jgi:hypothetical protein
MANILRDYKCAKHGYFESFDAKCPMKACEEEVMVVFLQPPGLISDKTKGNDKRLNQLAIDFNMTNIKSTREGDSQAGYYTRHNETPPEQPREPRPGDAAIWGGNKGLSMQSILAGGAVRPVRDEPVGIRPAEVGNLTGPRAASYVADHENLSIQK